MNKFKKIISLILLVILVLSLFSACSKSKYDKVFEFYSFDKSIGNFTKTDDDYVGLLYDTMKVYHIKDGSMTYDELTFDKPYYKDNDEIIYYASDYYIAPKSSLIATYLVNNNNDYEAVSKINGKNYILNNNTILSNGVVVGNYEEENNYITISFAGEVSTYLMLEISKPEDAVKEYGLFSSFYSSIKIVHSGVENTGFDIDLNVLTNNKEGEKIDIVPYLEDYVITDSKIEVMSDGGFDYSLDKSGSIILGKPKIEELSDIILSVTVDGLTKHFNVKPVHISFAVNQFGTYEIGNSIDLNDEKFINIFGLDRDKVDLSYEIENTENLVKNEEEIYQFVEEGYVVIHLKAQFELDGEKYEISDSVAVNIVEKNSNQNEN